MRIQRKRVKKTNLKGVLKTGMANAKTVQKGRKTESKKKTERKRKSTETVEKQKSETRMTASVLKQDPDT